MSELLLEFLSEEMPACMLHNFSHLMLSAISQRIASQESSVFYTPRRICIHIKGISHNTKNEIIKGPRITAGITAIEGFRRKYNIESQDKLMDDGEFYQYYRSDDLSLSNKVAMAIESAFSECKWPKSMKWSDYEINWVRPLHSIACMFDNEKLDVKFGHLSSVNYTVGHRFLSNKRIKLNGADIDIYKEALLKHKVIASIDDRKSMILTAITQVLSPLNLSLIEDESLLNEIANLVEYPAVFIGQIDQKFMKLPKEVLITTLKVNQKYLLVQDEIKNLAPYFIIVSNNIPTDGGDEIINGNQRVLSARLYDALFFYEKDKEINLSKRIDDLKTLIFHKDIGSVYDKILSVKKTAKLIADYFKIDSNKVLRAIDLMKADLTTSMVKEFPQLQGIMGSYYAAHFNENEYVCLAICEHYKPIGPSDDIPSQEIGLIVALSDKLDTLSQMFAINTKPTGSRDPYALRRAANGVIRILKHLNSEIAQLSRLNISQSVIDFIKERNIN